MTVPLEQVDPGVPETLRQMLEIQLQHLSDAERQLLKCASVAGQRFTAWSVATDARARLRRRGRARVKRWRSGSSS